MKLSVHVKKMLVKLTLAFLSLSFSEENNLLESVKQNSFMTEIATQLDVKCPRLQMNGKICKTNYVKKN